MAESSADILSITPSMLDWLSDYEISDLITYFDPDGIFIVQDQDSQLSYSEVQELIGDKICFFPAKEQKKIRHTPINGVDFSVINGVEHVNLAEKVEPRFVSNIENYAYLITTDINVKIDTNDLTADLVNKDKYKEYTGKTERKYVYMSGALPAHYRQKWGDMIVQGVRPEEVRGGLLIPNFTCYSNGLIKMDKIRSTSLGLRAINDVGRKTAERLSDKGFDTRKKLARATRGDLKEIQGIGEKKSNGIWYHSRAMENNTIKRKTSNPLPGKNPVFIDIATDGYNPSIIWFIAVFDSKRGEYETFIAENPNRKETVIQSFISWYAGGRQDQTMISWRGWEGNYQHIERFINEYAGEYIGIYDYANKRDLYYWINGLDNAVLPERDDNLIRNATHLGVDFPDSRIDEHYVMNAYREWMSNERDKIEWDLVKQYYRNRIRATIAIYNELKIQES